MNPDSEPQATSDRLIAALRGDGHRITAARRAICSVLGDAGGEHLDAVEIHRRVGEAAGATVDQSTVYRTLDALERTGMVVHSHLGHGPAVYHLAELAHHQHFVCDECGSTTAVAASDLEAWTSAIRRRTGFVVEPSHFALSGLCAECAGRRDTAGG